MTKAAIRKASSKNKLTKEQIKILQEAGFTAEQIAALPNVFRLTSAQSDLAIEIGAIPSDEEEIPLDKMVQLADDEIDYSDIPRGEEGGWKKPVVVTPKQSKELVSIRLDHDLVDFFRQQGKGYSTQINAVLRAYVEAQKTAKGRGAD